jgi:hypothetical protein
MHKRFWEIAITGTAGLGEGPKSNLFVSTDPPVNNTSAPAAPSKLPLPSLFTVGIGRSHIALAI